MISADKLALYMFANSPLPSSTPSELVSVGVAMRQRAVTKEPVADPSHRQSVQEMQAWRRAWQRRTIDSRSRLCPSVRFLLGLGFDRSTLVQASELALINGTNAAAEMIAAGQLSRIFYDRALARAASLAYVSAGDIDTVLIPLSQSALLLRPHGIFWCRLKNGVLCRVAVVDPRQAERLIGIAQHEDQHDLLVVSSPCHLKQHMLENRAAQLRQLSSNYLTTHAPKDCARSGANFGQGVLVTLFVGLLVFGFATGPTLGAVLVHITLSLFFIACAMMRLGATIGPGSAAADDTVVLSNHDDKPVYSVLVTLLDEVALVPGLVHHLSKLRWPATKIEIKLICEAHDEPTIAVLRAQQLDERFEIIIVPPGGPTTKPNALCYAMAFCQGTLVTLYDAEDRPHPMQLEEAWQRFRDSDAELACVQAPLEIANATHNRFTALFHMEYAGLFKRILPWLARRKLPLPLGGTSNHFRRAALEDVGLWDPYNVTEDADLGYRLWERGYRLETITLPTIEDAPNTFADWLPQRTRWFKGWMQTWIVHSRKSGAIIERHGLWRFLLAHIVLTGIVVSALLHPLVLVSAVTMAIWLAGNAISAGEQAALLAIDTSTLLLSYGAFCVLGWQTTTPAMRREIGHHAWATPFYWMAMSLAAWRALFQMFHTPFHWEKTRHQAYAFEPDE